MFLSQKSIYQSEFLKEALEAENWSLILNKVSKNPVSISETDRRSGAFPITALETFEVGKTAELKVVVDRKS
jgi:hypothetical protein